MLIKDGSVLPQIMYEALSRDEYAMRVFIQLSEFYQKMFVAEITRPQIERPMRERINFMLEELNKYGGEKGIK